MPFLTGPFSDASVAGVVLAGGKSSRLGQDKTRLSLIEGRQNLLACTVELLLSCTTEVVISCRKGSEEQHQTTCRLIADVVPDEGPFGGMLSVLREIRKPLLVVSCDLPFMDKSTLRRLLDAREHRPTDTLMTTFQQIETGYIEALTSIYEPDCLEWFEKAFASGIRQLNRVVPEERRFHIPYPQGAAAFFNLNYPADLEQARHLVAHS